MRKLFGLFLVAVAAPLLFVACQPDAPDTAKEYVLEITSDTTMEFPAEGGDGNIEWYDCVNGEKTDTDYHSQIWVPIKKI